MQLSWITVSLDMLLMIIQNFLLAFFTGRFIRTRKMVLFCVLYVFLYTAGYAVIEYFFPDYKAFKAILLPVFALVVTIIFRNISLLKSVFFQIILQILLIGTDYLLLLFYRTVLPNHIDEMISICPTGNVPIGSLSFSFLMLLRCSGILSIFVCVLCTYYMLRGSRFEDGAYDVKLNRIIPIFILEIIAVSFLMYYTARTTISDSGIVWLMLGFMGMFLALDAFLLNILKSVEDAERVKYEKAEASLLAASHAAAYEQLIQGTAGFRMLRHDMLNQMQTINVLLERGQVEAARDQLSSYANEVRSSRAPLTGNSIVDAVLSIKKEACDAAGIALEISGRLPEDAPLDRAKLCGVVGNMLDNAIHGALDSNPSTKPAGGISVSFAVRDDKLVISCRNPSSGLKKASITAPKLESEHGWGLYILDLIARENGGAFTLNEEGDTATALFWVPFHAVKNDGE